MLRHDIQPGKLVAGFFLTLTAVVYAGDAEGAWEVPWFVAIPLVVAGLCLAGATAFLAHAIRRHRSSPRPGHAPEHGQVPDAGIPDRVE
ncbi:hypothetical protein ACFS5L_12765 [Streptomyces phyllanthi]|uniref:Uncharacterized protein n=1 Tax=Streptomyces phyllanthi TaxID=1803180 RepID=A0A5N8WIJ1_9ACTN|nr:hypothetical protein [Streptomyces phyllanthi]MPY47027.1 hypothetical protein [Streptomyces phyllanthi]